MHCVHFIRLRINVRSSSTVQPSSLFSRICYSFTSCLTCTCSIQTESFRFDVISEQITESTVREFLHSCCSENTENEVILEYIHTELQKLHCDIRSTTITTERYHKLLLLLSQLPLKLACLEVIPQFMHSSAISVQIAVERYLLHILNAFHLSTSNDDVNDYTVKHFIHSHQSLFRPTFLVCNTHTNYHLTSNQFIFIRFLFSFFCVCVCV